MLLLRLAVTSPMRMSQLVRLAGGMCETVSSLVAASEGVSDAVGVTKLVCLVEMF